MTTGDPICPKHGYQCCCEELSRKWLGTDSRYRLPRIAIETSETWRLTAPEVLAAFMRERWGEDWLDRCMAGNATPIAVLTIPDAIRLIERVREEYSQITESMG